MAGRGSFEPVGPDTLEIRDGPGLLWHPGHALRDFVLVLDWCLLAAEGNSGVFLRMPPLSSSNDWTRAVREGIEVQIDDRGVDPERGGPARRGAPRAARPSGHRRGVPAGA